MELALQDWLLLLLLRLSASSSSTKSPFGISLYRENIKNLVGTGGDILSISLAACSLMIPNIVLECISHVCAGFFIWYLHKNLWRKIISLTRASQWSRLVELVSSGNSSTTVSDLEICKEKLIHVNDKSEDYIYFCNHITLRWY